MNKIDFREKKSEYWLFGAIVCVLLAITFYPLTKAWFVVGDDLEFYLRSGHWGTWMESARLSAEYTGRFSYMLVKWVYFIPYLVDSEVYLFVMRSLPILLFYTLLVVFIKKVVKDSMFGLLFAVFCCTFFTTWGWHSVITSYPLYFSLSFSMVLAGLNLVLVYFDKKKYYLLILSAFLLGLATLFYESYLVYYLLVAVLILSKYKLKEFVKKESLVKMFKELAPFVFFGVAYLLTYYIYFKSQNVAYTGSQFSDKLSLKVFLSTLMQMLYDSLPLRALAQYSWIKYMNTDAFTASNSGGLIPNMSLIACIKGFLIGVIFYLLAKRYNSSAVSRRTCVVVMITALIFAILPHVPLALSERYMNGYEASTYVPSSFSFFSMLVVYIAIYCLIFSFVEKKVWLRNFFIITMSVLMGLFAALIQNNNECIASDLDISKKHFELMSYFAGSDMIADGDNIYIDQLNLTSSEICYSVTKHGGNLNDFLVRMGNGKNIKGFNGSYSDFYAKFKDSEQIVKLVNFSQANNSGDAYIAVYACKGTNLSSDWSRIRANEMQVVYMSDSKRFGVSVLNEGDASVKIADAVAGKISDLNRINLSFKGLPEFCQFSIIGEQLIPSTLSISNMLFKNTNSIKIGQYPKIIEDILVDNMIVTIRNSADWMKVIEDKAAKSGKSVERVLSEDARWMISQDK